MDEQQTKPAKCPVCRKPYSGRFRFTAVEAEIERDGETVTLTRDFETYLHANGKKCERQP